MHYLREEEQVIIDQQALVQVPRLHAMTHDVPHESNTITNVPEIPQKAKIAVPAQVLKCDGPALNPGPSAPPAPAVDVKTTNIKPDSVSGTARKTRKGTVLFTFPEKSHRKQ